MVSRKRCDAFEGTWIDTFITCQQRWSLGSDATVGRVFLAVLVRVPTALVSRKRCDFVTVVANVTKNTCQQRWSLGSDATVGSMYVLVAVTGANSVGLSEAMRQNRFSGSFPQYVVPTALVSRKRCDDVDDDGTVYHIECQQRWSLGSDATLISSSRRAPSSNANSVGLSEAMRLFQQPPEPLVTGCQQRWSLGSDATQPLDRIPHAPLCQQRWSLGCDATLPSRVRAWLDRCQQRWSLGSDATS